MFPMMAQPLDLHDAKYQRQWARCLSGGYWMEPKLDGMRLVLALNSKGEIQSATTRSGRSVLDRLRAMDWTTKAIWPEARNQVLDVELGYISHYWQSCPILDFNATMRVMGSSAGEAALKHATNMAVGFNPLTACIFDLPNVPGTLAERRRTLLSRALWPSPFVFEIVPQLGQWDVRTYDEYVSAGGEGIMLKNPESFYVPGGRPTQTWYKVKKFNTIDVVITGAQAGQGKYAGQVGAVKFGLFDHANGRLVEVGQCSGMTDDMRAELSRELPVGKVMEIKYFGLTAGTPRHPQFVRMREDKEAIECSTQQIQ